MSKTIIKITGDIAATAINVRTAQEIVHRALRDRGEDNRTAAGIEAELGQWLDSRPEPGKGKVFVSEKSRFTAAVAVKP